MLEAFLATLPAGGCAPRSSFATSRGSPTTSTRCCGAHGAALCIAESEDLATPLEATAGWGYLRLRRQDYDEAALRRLGRAPAGAAAATTAYVFFKHEDEGAGPRACRFLPKHDDLTSDLGGALPNLAGIPPGITLAHTMARAIAGATVSFGLVSIPVKLFAATQASAGVSFNLLHKKCGTRLKQQYICPTDNEIVRRDDMVKGYEFAKDQYVTFTPDELKSLEEKATGSIDIAEFVPLAAIDPVYFDRPYYLGPEKGGDKAYLLLAEAMRETRPRGAGPLRRARQAVPGDAAPDARTGARWCCSSCCTPTRSARWPTCRCPTARCASPS